MIINGLQVSPNHLCLEKTDEPVKIHKEGKKLSYHRRIQKKWIKRFGWVMKPCMYVVGGRVLVCHPSFIPELRKIGRGSDT